MSHRLKIETPLFYDDVISMCFKIFIHNEKLISFISEGFWSWQVYPWLQEKGCPWDNEGRSRPLPQGHP